MKKYNSVNWNKWWIYGLVSVLMFVISFSGAYAYFTATAQERAGNIQSAIISVEFSSATTSQVVSNEVIVSRNVEPGDKVGFNGAVVNSGNMPLYAMLVFKISIDGTDIATQYYTADATLLTPNASGSYTTALSPISASGSTNFSIEYLLDGEIYDNTYMGKTISMSLTACAIQTSHVDADDAINIMLDVLTENI